jgi:hypothetical protein
MHELRMHILGPLRCPILLQCTPDGERCFKIVSDVQGSVPTVLQWAGSVHITVAGAGHA